jgi:hypothetical protein
MFIPKPKLREQDFLLQCFSDITDMFDISVVRVRYSNDNPLHCAAEYSTVESILKKHKLYNESQIIKLDPVYPFYKLHVKNEMKKTKVSDGGNNKSFYDYYNDPKNYGHGL